MFNKTYCPKCGRIVTAQDHVCSEEKAAPLGWRCPVCGKGNAPWVLFCGHCERKFPTIEDWEWGPPKKHKLELKEQAI